MSSPKPSSSPSIATTAGATGLLKAVDWIERHGLAIGLAVIIITGFGLGFANDSTDNIDQPYNRISSIIGWIYFACWSVSFWPQVFLNWRRQSVVGLSLDFLVYNSLGFTCYTIYNCAFFWSGAVQVQYMKIHNGHPNSVQSNDVFFAIHAILVTLFTVYQTTVYTRGDQNVSFLCKAIVTIAILLALVFFIVCFAAPTSSLFTTLNFLYFLSYIKLGISLIKYIPQAVLNYQRKSTVGWTIWNVLLDFSGGMLSLAQLIMTAIVTDDWSAATGNPVKFGLGFVSVFFDIIFITQHYILYPEKAHDKIGEITPDSKDAPLLKA
ncbi:Aste57867_19347 [Aphanomyces stellatus]|uniref:Aste57867_19347 protein n=1 Tax=Aphanomyces stellatus TaxID=120398 RepID=A0A485LCG9_9STRA|nr:hypothetical protein As57867_019283 [Aphanomyces stellatus]VFT96061.1 Aste57867_19347 [Aphanomyces stellatus]